MQNKRLIGILVAVPLLLLIPFIGMQVSDQVVWSAGDFIIAGVLLLSTGLLCEFIIRIVKKKEYRMVILLVILMAFLLTWVELAVGIFGTPFAGT